ncbi:hypothetical protein DMENIID0001_054550 [Sergentomyia squamirostris]
MGSSPEDSDGWLSSVAIDTLFDEFINTNSPGRQRSHPAVRESLRQIPQNDDVPVAESRAISPSPPDIPDCILESIDEIFTSIGGDREDVEIRPRADEKCVKKKISPRAEKFHGGVKEYDAMKILNRSMNSSRRNSSRPNGSNLGSRKGIFNKDCRKFVEKRSGNEAARSFRKRGRNDDCGNHRRSSVGSSLPTSKRSSQSSSWDSQEFTEADDVQKKCTDDRKLPEDSRMGREDQESTIRDSDRKNNDRDSRRIPSSSSSDAQKNPRDKSDRHVDQKQRSDVRPLRKSSPSSEGRNRNHLRSPIRPARHSGNIKDTSRRRTNQHLRKSPAATSYRRPSRNQRQMRINRDSRTSNRRTPDLEVQRRQREESQKSPKSTRRSGRIDQEEPHRESHNYPLSSSAEIQNYSRDSFPGNAEDEDLRSPIRPDHFSGIMEDTPRWNDHDINHHRSSGNVNKFRTDRDSRSSSCNLRDPVPAQVSRIMEEQSRWGTTQDQRRSPAFTMTSGNYYLDQFRDDRGPREDRYMEGSIQQYREYPLDQEDPYLLQRRSSGYPEGDPPGERKYDQYNRERMISNSGSYENNDHQFPERMSATGYPVYPVFQSHDARSPDRVYPRFMDNVSPRDGSYSPNGYRANPSSNFGPGGVIPEQSSNWEEAYRTPSGSAYADTQISSSDHLPDLRQYLNAKNGRSLCRKLSLVENAFNASRRDHPAGTAEFCHQTENYRRKLADIRRFIDQSLNALEDLHQY